MKKMVPPGDGLSAFASRFAKPVRVLCNFHWDPSHTHSLMMHRNFDFVFTTDKLRVRLE